MAFKGKAPTLGKTQIGGSTSTTSPRQALVNSIKNRSVVAPKTRTTAVRKLNGLSKAPKR